MRRMSMSEMTTYSWSFDEDLFQFGGVGYGALGVWRAKLNDYGQQRGCQLLEDLDFSVSSLAWIGGFTGNDIQTHDESICDGLRAIRLAHDLKAGCLITHTGARGGHTTRHARRLVFHALDRLLPLAEELGVVLAVEPMHPRCAGEWTFLTSVSDALQLIEEVGSPNLKFVWDTYHLCDEDMGIDRLERIVDHIALVQLGDARAAHSLDHNRCRLGDGQLAWDVALRQLVLAGYGGYWEAELLGEDVESFGYEVILQSSLAAVADLAPTFSVSENSRSPIDPATSQTRP